MLRVVIVCCVLFSMFVADAATGHSERGRTVFKDPVENRVSEFESDCGCRCNISGGKTVVCSGCRCVPDNLPNDTVALRLNDSSLGHLSSKSFAHLPLLRRLALVKCHVTSIDIGTFDHLTHLEDIDLTGNPDIGQLPDEIFSKLPNLTRLVLTHVQRSCEFNESFYLRLKRLRYLSLERNQLINFPRFLDAQNQTTALAESLKFLNLNRNNMRKLFGQYFHGLESLEMLTLSANSIAFVDNSTFENLTFLKTLILDFNPLVYIYDTSFLSESLNYLSIVRTVYKPMDNHNPVRFFQGMNNLTVLNVSHSIWIMNSVAHHFRDLKNLEVLVTEGNQISDDELPYLIGNLTRLRHLDLTDNNLNFLEEIPFEDLQNLSVLLVGDNWLITVGAASLAPRTWKSLERVDFSLNPLICDCGIVWFRRWLKVTAKVKRIRVDNRDLIRCAAPVKVKKHLVSNVTHPSDEECFRDDLTALYATAAIVILVKIFGTLAAVLHRFRWHLKYWYFVYQSESSTLDDEGDGGDDDDRRYSFDAFISHDSSDSRWVVRHLIPRLESDWDLRLCIGQRNWIPGSDIADSVATSIERSRKTVLVASNAFAVSHWSHFEMTMAQTLQTEKDRDGLVVVLLEEIAGCNMNPRLQLQMQRGRHIEWTRNPVGQRLFWAKFRVALTRKSKSIVRSNPPRELFCSARH